MRRAPVVAFVLVAFLAACEKFPPPTPPVTPLTKQQVSTVAKCQTAIKKSQLAFIKTKLAALESCVDGVLNLRLQFENGLTAQGAFDTGIVKMRGKCQKNYDKISGASTKLVDAIVKACTPAEEFVFGSYDALRFQSQSTTDPFGAIASVVDLAGHQCSLTEELVDTQLWLAAPRLIELLGYLGPEFVLVTDVNTGRGFPNVPLDARCPPLQGTPTPTATPAETATPTPTATDTPTPAPTATP